MPGVPPVTPNLGLPRFAGTDDADFAGQINSVVDLLDDVILPPDPLDDDLAAIAALATQPFGRSLLTLADAAAARAALGVVGVQIGDLVPGVVAGDSADGKFLAADGRLSSTTTYAALFALIGHAANGGVDPGGGQFRLPDLRGRIPVGADNMGTAAGAAARLTANAARGNSGGAEKHTLITAELASHAHSIPIFNNPGGALGTKIVNADEANPGAAGASASSAAGGGGAHNNMQPNQVWNWRVRAL